MNKRIAPVHNHRIIQRTKLNFPAVPTLFEYKVDDVNSQVFRQTFFLLSIETCWNGTVSVQGK